MAGQKQLHCAKFQPSCHDFGGECLSNSSCSIFSASCSMYPLDQHSCQLFQQYLNETLQNSTLPADDDIVGDGTLAAFFFTAAIAILTVLFAYLSNALDETSLNYIDRRIIATARASWYRVFPCRRKRHESISSIVDYQQTRRMRNEGLTQFILSLSDQQLITGLAVILAGVANQEYFSRYEFIIVHSLAWFSSTTHLATLDTLRYYFNTHRGIHTARTVGISIFLLLMAYSMFLRVKIAMSGLGMEIPVACVYVIRTGISTCSNWSGTFNKFWQSAWLIALLLVLIGYFIRIQDFYTHQRHPFYIVHWILWRSRHPGTVEPHQRVFEERRAALRLERLSATVDRRGLMRILPIGYDDSYLSSIPGILFSFSYSVTQIIAVRWLSNPPPTVKVSVLGYGQMVTILLLCLPFMAAGEAISDFRFNLRQQLEGYNRRPSIVFDTPIKITPLQFDDFPAIDATYERAVPRMRGFFSKYINDIEDKRSRLTHVETIRLKQLLLAKFERLEDYQNTIKIWPSLAWFVANCLGSIVSGVLLNIANFDDAGRSASRRIICAMVIFLVYMASKALCLAWDIVMMLRINSP